MENEGAVLYTLFWDNHVTGVIQKDGPVTIMDFDNGKSEINLYPDFSSAKDSLLAKLATLLS
jgi:hypothetical protein